MLKRRPRFRSPRKKRYWIIALVGLLLFAAVYQLENSVEKTLLKLAKTRVKNISQQAVSEAFEEVEASLGPDLDQLMNIKHNEDGSIAYIQTDAEIQAKVYQVISNQIQQELRKLEQQDNGIPLGAVLQSSLFSDVGPDVPLQIWPKGSTKVDVVAAAQDKGINTVLVSFYLRVKNEMSIMVPMNYDDVIPVEYHYPLDSVVINGEVPENYYYYNNEGKGKGMEGPIPVVPADPGKNSR
ncbi:MAG: sporulation protein YunB [Firmicutes bacterium]|nr:sporulation protein YunB [Melghirimyces thermohalophilus]MDA8353554.1 sporulation protein YunB [Bacillota bacterium]